MSFYQRPPSRLLPRFPVYGGLIANSQRSYYTFPKTGQEPEQAHTHTAVLGGGAARFQSSATSADAPLHSPTPSYAWSSSMVAEVYGMQDPAKRTRPVTETPAEYVSPSIREFNYDEFPYTTRKRASHACEPCKKRKARCDNEEEGACDRCRSKDLKCWYADRTKKAPRSTQRAREQLRAAQRAALDSINSGASDADTPQSLQESPSGDERSLGSISAPNDGHFSTPLQTLGAVPHESAFISPGSSAVRSPVADTLNSDPRSRPWVAPAHAEPWNPTTIALGYPHLAGSATDTYSYIGQVGADAYGPSLHYDHGDSQVVQPLSVDPTSSSRAPARLMLQIPPIDAPCPGFPMLSRRSTLAISTGVTCSSSSSSEAPSPRNNVLPSPAVSATSAYDRSLSAGVIESVFGEHEEYYARLGAMHLTGGSDDVARAAAMGRYQTV